MEQANSTQVATTPEAGFAMPEFFQMVMVVEGVPTKYKMEPRQVTQLVGATVRAFTNDFNLKSNPPQTLPNLTTVANFTDSDGNIKAHITVSPFVDDGTEFLLPPKTKLDQWIERVKGTFGPDELSQIVIANVDSMLEPDLSSEYFTNQIVDGITVQDIRDFGPGMFLNDEIASSLCRFIVFQMLEQLCDSVKLDPGNEQVREQLIFPLIDFTEQNLPTVVTMLQNSIETKHPSLVVDHAALQVWADKHKQALADFEASVAAMEDEVFKELEDKLKNLTNQENTTTPL